MRIIIFIIIIFSPCFGDQYLDIIESQSILKGKCSAVFDDAGALWPAFLFIKEAGGVWLSGNKEIVQEIEQHLKESLIESTLLSKI